MVAVTGLIKRCDTLQEMEEKKAKGKDRLFSVLDTRPSRWEWEGVPEGNRTILYGKLLLCIFLFKNDLNTKYSTVFCIYTENQLFFFFFFWQNVEYFIILCFYTKNGTLFFSRFIRGGTSRQSQSPRECQTMKKSTSIVSHEMSQVEKKIRTD